MTWRALAGVGLLAIGVAAGCGGGSSGAADAAGLDGARADARAVDAMTDAMTDAMPPDAAPTAVERGARLASLAGCARCHTPPRHLEADGVPFCGDPLFRDLVPGDPLLGRLPAPNLTPTAAGLATFTDEMISRAVREGVGGDGRRLHWVMSSFRYSLFTDAEMADLIAFLRALPPCDQDTRSLRQDLGFVVPVMTPLTWADVPRTTLPPADPAYASAERGRAISVLSPCIACHSGPEPSATDPGITLPFVDGYAKLFTGGRTFGPDVSRNLTPDATGLLGWAAPQVRGTLDLGLDFDGQYVCGAMQSHVGANADLLPPDMLDLGNYFTTIPPVVNDTGPNPTCVAPAARLVIGPGGLRTGLTEAERPADFGAVTVGAVSSEITFRITNSSGIETSGTLGPAAITGDFELVSDGCVGMAVPPTGKIEGPRTPLPGCTITARYRPTGDGPATGSLVVTATPGGTTTAALVGMGIAP